MSDRDETAILSSKVEAPGSAKIDDLDVDKPTDPVVLLWQEWKEAYRSIQEVQRLQQKLEKKLFQLVGRFPQVEVQIPGVAEPVNAITIRQLDALLPEPEQRAQRQKAKSVLYAQNKACNAVDIEIGYTAAYDAELEIAQRQRALAKSLWETPAKSISGVIAKMEFVIDAKARERKRLGGDQSVPELSLMLADLVQLERSAV